MEEKPCANEDRGFVEENRRQPNKTQKVRQKHQMWPQGLPEAHAVTLIVSRGVFVMPSDSARVERFQSRC